MDIPKTELQSFVAAAPGWFAVNVWTNERSPDEILKMTDGDGYELLHIIGWLMKLEHPYEARTRENAFITVNAVVAEIIHGEEEFSTFLAPDGRVIVVADTTYDSMPAFLEHLADNERKRLERITKKTG